MSGVLAVPVSVARPAGSVFEMEKLLLTNILAFGEKPLYSSSVNLYIICG